METMQFNVKSYFVSSLHQMNCDKNYFSRKVLTWKGIISGFGQTVLHRDKTECHCQSQRRKPGSWDSERPVCGAGQPLVLVEFGRNYFTSQSLPLPCLQSATLTHRENGDPHSRPKALCLTLQLQAPLHPHFFLPSFFPKKWSATPLFPFKASCVLAYLPSHLLWNPSLCITCLVLSTLPPINMSIYSPSLP